MDGSAAELEAAERVVMRWDSTSAGAGADEPMLFAGGGDRAEADRFLRAVDDLRRLAPPSPAAVGSPRRLSSSSASGSGAVQVAMARLEDEFRHALSSRALDLEIEALADLSSLSINSDRSNSASSADLPAPAGGDEDDSVPSSIGRAAAGRTLLRGRRRAPLDLDSAAAADGIEVEQTSKGEEEARKSWIFHAPDAKGTRRRETRPSLGDGTGGGGGDGRWSSEMELGGEGNGKGELAKRGLLGTPKSGFSSKRSIPYKFGLPKPAPDRVHPSKQAQPALWKHGPRLVHGTKHILYSLKKN